MDLFSHNFGLDHVTKTVGFILSTYARFQASAAMQMRSAPYCDITRRRAVIPHRTFGTASRKFGAELLDVA